MAWIEIIPESQADSELTDCYAEVRALSGDLDEVLTVHSLHPAGLRAHWAVYRAAMRPTRTLRLRDRELLAIVVSAINGCDY
jgi:alkylhydroperoxidase family enzyme